MNETGTPEMVGSMAGLGAGAEVRCWCCHACRPVTLDALRIILCPDCGCKRCPKASHHSNACTNSNEPDQHGSVYGGVCRYPDCHCPFDAPADPKWCAKGLPHLRAPNVGVKAAPLGVGSNCLFGFWF